MIVARVVNEAGRAFNVRLVRLGDRYGLDDCLVHDEDEPLVEFYDATYENTPDFGERGQFVSRYYLATFRAVRGGIDLCGYVREWEVSAANVAAALGAVDRALA